MRPPLARVPVGAVALAVTLVLLAVAGRYDYHRDELYFRVLGQHPAWGYIDQPPLTPLLTRLGTILFGDSVWALRVPFALLTGVAAVLAALLAREAGGGRAAQVLAALGVAGGYPISTGHAALTNTPDLVTWLAVLLFVLRLLLRNEPRYWLAVGAVVGVGLYNKHLVVLLLLVVGVGLLAVGPRRVLLSGWLAAGIGLALLIGLPNLVYQVAHGFPQLAMARTLAAHKGADARATLLPLQLALIGPAPVWMAGLWFAWRDRRIRALAVAYPVMVVLLLVMAGQPYYVSGLLLALYAIGCVPVVRWVSGHRGRRAFVAAGVGLWILVALFIALPVLPPAAIAATPVPAANPVVKDGIGWRVYVRQVAAVWRTLPATDRAGAVVVAANYGEAGAIDRYGPALGMPPAYSGQNSLYDLGRPPASATVAVTVGRLPAGVFASCRTQARLDNGVGLDNEEQGLPVAVCRGPRAPWPELWPRFRHLD